MTDSIPQYDSRRPSVYEVHPDQYHLSTDSPRRLAEASQRLSQFVEDHASEPTRRIALVTSGGTAVPLESQTVRFIDNFSMGTRVDYAVVFLYRQYSLQPYSRHYSHLNHVLLDFFEKDHHGDVKFKQEHLDLAQDSLQKYERAKANNLLLLLEFNTVGDYLSLLQLCAQTIAPVFKGRALFYLAAAVSDFFIPKPIMSEHKIQSREGALELRMDQVPKFLKPLVRDWVGDGMVVSFKLETNPNLLEAKAVESLKRYGHSIVIGNILKTRKQEVVFVVPKEDKSGYDSSWIRLDESPKAAKTRGRPAKEIEGLIVPELVRRHTLWMQARRMNDG